MEAVDILSPRAYQVAEAHNLGVPRVEFRSKKPLFWPYIFAILWWGAIFFVVSSRLSLLVAPMAVKYDELMFGSDITGGILFICGLLVLWFPLKKWMWGASRFYLCAGGFVIGTTKYVKEVVRWEDIAGIQRYSILPPENSMLSSTPLGWGHVFVTSGGRGYTFDDGRGRLLVQCFTEALLPSILERYEASQAFQFGALTLNSEGIWLIPDERESLFQEARYSTGMNWIMRKALGRLDRKFKLRGIGVEAGEHFISWEGMHMPWIDESQGALVISRGHETWHWAMVPLHKVTNVEICLQLMEYILCGEVLQDESHSLATHTLATDAEQAVETSQLIGVYRTKMRYSDMVRFGLQCLLYCFMLSPFVFSIFLFYVIRIFGPYPVPLISLLPSAFFSLNGFVFVCLSAASTLRRHKTLVTPLRRKIIVHLYKDGFVYHEGREKRVVAWSQIELVRRKSALQGYGQIQTDYIVRLKNGSAITLLALIKDVDELGSVIERGVAEAQ
ncbi:hypothetical protein KSX_65810 [Ktedonospora formicarum]|uniref:Uncharacterized protein n=1 Tax=Ktedonospora formicarum TaxID=2778364 RepID=A0A8J3MW87_9CHLR|nr:hypothetical protein KSX_65810 [Ktedonospora formicarum]